MTSYIYRGKPEEKVFGPLPDGDYHFTVSEAGPVYYKNDKWILPVRLRIEPSGMSVFSNPWSGTTQFGEERDGIGEFLLAINRAPKEGAEPDWGTLAGARGKCRLKQEKAEQGKLAGQLVNKVAFWHRPHQLEEPGKGAPRPVGPELDDDIPMEPF